jgi:hypothetical protein
MNLASIWEAFAHRVRDGTALVHGLQRVSLRDFDWRAAFAAARTRRDTKVAMYLAYEGYVLKERGTRGPGGGAP